MAQILYLTNIQIDFGVISTLGAACDKAGIHRPLIVTDPLTPNGLALGRV
jgi:alcohol dehydrogenase class IV